MEQAEEAINEARKCSRNTPPYVWRTWGDVLRKKRMWDEANDAYGKATELNPQDARAWDGLAMVTRERRSHLVTEARPGGGKFEDEIAFFKRAVDANPTEPYGWNQLGDAYYRAKQFKASIRAHSKARRLDRQNSYAMDGIGKALLGLGSTERAKQFYQAATQANPADAYARHGVAAALMLEGDYEGSLAENENAVELDADAAYVWNGIGDSCERLRRYDEAISAYRSALELDGRDAYAHSCIARVLLEQGQIREAVTACDKALELDARAAFALTTRGDIHYRQGNHAEAIKAYNQALVADPISGDACDGLGKAYVWLEDYANASLAYDTKGRIPAAGGGRFLLGGADVLLRKIVAGIQLRKTLADDDERALEEAEKQYQDCAAHCPELALTAHVRLAVIARWKRDTHSAQHAVSACEAFQCAWDRRSHADSDLDEFYALALLLQGDVEAALAKLRTATTQREQRWRFDSERVGAYILLQQSKVKGFKSYLAGIPSITPGLPR